MTLVKLDLGICYMKAYELKKNVYWVGAKDWNLRDFHGYKTSRGSTYNAYLIIDEKITLVDGVKDYMTDEMLSRISSIISPDKIDYVVCNHVEMDHSGAIPKVMQLAKNAKLVTNPAGKKGLEDHYDVSGWDFEIVKSGAQLSLGEKTLSFVTIPMLHWPDSMMTYLKEDKILLPNDAFGQHYASEHIFADEVPKEILFEEAKKYFANILYPYSKKLSKLLSGFDLDVEMLAPSHGLIWRGEQISEILEEYKKWANGVCENKALIVYDTMWKTTEKLSILVEEAFEELGVKVIKRSLKHNDISDVITDVVDVKYVAIGSPCLNSTYLPTMGAFLTYLRGLSPKDKTGFVFGSYGWKTGFSSQITSILEDLGWNLPEGAYEAKYQNIDKDEIRAKIANVIKSGEE
jgi:flavorubredoxin